MSTIAIAASIEIYIPNGKFVTEDIGINAKWSKEIFKGYVVFTSGIGFKPDDHSKCFDREGIYKVGDNGITLTHARAKTDLYEHYNKYDENKIVSVVVGDETCRYKISVQREIKVDGTWQKSDLP